MVELDETDAEILRLLMEDARRPYKEIADEVGLSAPSVSNRIERLEDLGVIDRFTVDIDRSMLATGDAVQIDIEARPGCADAVVEALRALDGVECIFRAIDPRVTVYAYMNDDELQHVFSEVLDDGQLLGYEVRKVMETVWQPRVGQADLAIECVECGKPIRNEGISIEIDDRRYYLCCPSCESLFRERYQQMEREAEAGRSQ